jgi:hypothetical protein
MVVHIERVLFGEEFVAELSVLVHATNCSGPL